MNLLVLILAILFLAGAFGGGHLGFYPVQYGYGGGVGIVVVILIILLVTGRL